MAPDWQPIETAPLGEWVRLRFGDEDGDEDGPYVARMMEPELGWWTPDGLDFGYGFAKPTHWRPLDD